MRINWQQKAENEGTPFIDGKQVTFYWHGAKAPCLIGDFCDWENSPVEMQRAGKNHWISTLEFPLDAYIEYAYLRGEERQTDPFNPRRTPNGMGKFNHFFYMPDGHPTTLSRKNSRIPSGIVSRHTVPCRGLISGQQRTIYLYQPAVPGPYPLLVVWDGKDYLRRARIPQIVDALIAQHRMQPVAMALVENGGAARYMEYHCSEATLVFLETQVLPLAKAQLDLIDPEQHPGTYGVVGASMGGLMAMYTDLRLPRIFGRVLSQSGAFRMHEGWQDLVMDLVKAYGPQGQRIWMDIGIYDMPRLLIGNRQMRYLLIEKGFEMEYHEYPAGHNYPAWRDDIWRGLEFLFPVPKMEP